MNEYSVIIIFKNAVVPWVLYAVPGFYFIYYIWQDAGIWTRVATTAARCDTKELHTSLHVL